VTRSLGVAGVAASAIALLAGCGSSSSSTTGSTSAATTATTSAPSTAAAAATAAAPGVAVQVKKGKLGPILSAGPKRLTVYLFEADKGTASACTGACAKAWPPVTTGGAPVAAAGAVSADLGTIARADGTKQVTYKGHPLYFFAQDGDAGDAYGEGVKAFGADWYVMRPSGSKVDES
jgi:predicted lipoprotein with Yx(FWY)xxD motif